MICLLPSHAEGITLADITLRYVHCCYMVVELYYFSGIKRFFCGNILCLNYLISDALASVTQHGASSSCRTRNDLQVYRVAANIMYKEFRAADKW